MTYLSHTASFHSNERIAPSNRGIKHLGPVTFERVRMIVREGVVPPPGETGTPRMILGLDVLNQLQAYAVDAQRGELQMLSANTSGGPLSIPDR